MGARGTEILCTVGLANANDPPELLSADVAPNFERDWLILVLVDVVGAAEPRPEDLGIFDTRDAELRAPSVKA